MNGCNGAAPHAYTNWFINTVKGEGPHENAYAYTATKTTCQTVDKWSSGYKVASYKDAYSYGADSLKTVIAEYGAALVGVYASDSSFSNYASGVYQGCSSTSANHAVLAVGYGTENGVDYWLVKNSWGTNWGDKGYIKIKRGSNECGIEMEAMIYTKCSASDGSADTVPETPTTAAPAAALTCDLSNIFGPGITGNYSLQFRVNGQYYFSRVTCTNSVCTPQDPTGITNACVYICGMSSCG